MKKAQRRQTKIKASRRGTKASFAKKSVVTGKSVTYTVTKAKKTREPKTKMVTRTRKIWNTKQKTKQNPETKNRTNMDLSRCRGTLENRPATRIVVIHPSNQPLDHRQQKQSIKQKARKPKQ